MKFTYFGYDFFDNCLNYLLEEGHQLVALCTFNADERYNSTTTVTRLAEEQGVPILRHKLQKEDLRSFAQESDFFISAAYPYKISIGDDWDVKAINIHPSLLPKGRGVWPLPHVILQDETETGVTIHKMSNTFDAGEILLQQSFPVYPQENLETLTVRTRVIARELLGLFLQKPETYWRKAKEQDEISASVWSMPTDEQMKIDFTKDTDTIDRVVRAFGKMHSYFEYDDVQYLVESATVWKELHTYPPGTLVDDTRDEWLFATGNGFICIRHWKKE